MNGLAGCYVSTIGKPHEYFDLTGNLEDVLCKIHSDRRIFHSDSSFFDAFFRLDFGTSMPSMSAEESIPSLDGVSTKRSSRQRYGDGLEDHAAKTQGGRSQEERKD